MSNRPQVYQLGNQLKENSKNIFSKCIRFQADNMLHIKISLDTSHSVNTNQEDPNQNLSTSVCASCRSSYTCIKFTVTKKTF